MLQPEKIEAQKTSKNRIYRRGIIYILLIFIVCFYFKDVFKFDSSKPKW